MASASRATVQGISFSQFNDFTRLFTTYCSDYEALSAYYAGDFHDTDARKEAAGRAAMHPRDRTAVADALLEQNEAWGTLNDASRKNIEQLRDQESVAVVTGQQVGLFAGPLYTIYKTITALQLAEQLAEETGRPVTPVFWVEGEDHDFEEVGGIHLMKRNEPVAVRYSSPAAQNGSNSGPVGRLLLTDAIDEVISEIDDILPPTDFKPEVMRLVREAYRADVTLEDAFVHLHHALFPESGLVYINPDDARLKALTAPLFQKELENHDEAFHRLEEVSRRLEGAGYHAQVRAHPTNLFLLKANGRLALDAVDGAFRLRGSNETEASEELEDLLSSEPNAFSPNVVLRPLMQDTLLPTAAYVAGPGEIAYFAQYRPLYEWAGLPMPIIYPRASATLLESKVKRVLERYEMQPPDLEGDLEVVFQNHILEDMEIDGPFNDAQRNLHEAVNAVKPAAEQVDKSLIGTAEATRSALMKELDALKDRVVRAEKRNHDEVRAQLAKAQVNLFPNSRLQERMLNVLYYLNKYSPELVQRLRRELSLDTTKHQIIEL